MNTSDEYENHEPDYEEDENEEDRDEYKNLNRPEEDDEIDFDFDDRVSGQMQMVNISLFNLLFIIHLCNIILYCIIEYIDVNSII